ncbi:helix-turn-helix domain-containing protein [Mucilaginibacter pedocola]|uniref:Transcriptional regulator n=1 Tax=Mucilaginibacter pedocola TaxID=1792845 RepID=A0A1S9PKQ0_9SPHI|nr:helix-turn-helix transcriptional regulator [Mucilaginibacter pedocola]OOQ61536.1 transcriptional regulator [Mucilaginibacter pedocola]
MKSIGKTIRLLRRQRGWAQRDAASRLGISIPVFSKIEAGITDMSLSRIQQIADLFGLPIVDILANRQVSDHLPRDLLIAANKKLLRRENEITELRLKIIELSEQLKLPA